MLAAIVFAGGGSSASGQTAGAYSTRSVANPTPEEKLLMLNMLATCEHGPGLLVDAACREVDLDADGDVDLRDYLRLQGSGEASPPVRELFPPHALAPQDGTGWDITGATHLLIEFHHDQPLRNGTFRIVLETEQGDSGYYFGSTTADFWVHAGDHALILDLDRFPPHSMHVNRVRLSCYPSVELVKARFIIPQDHARVSLQWDDGYAQQWPAAAALEAIGQRGTFWIIGSGVGQPNYLTLAQVLELDARGHFVGNHSYSHLQLNVNATEDEVYDDFIAMAEWMEAVGLTRGARYAALPYGLGTTRLVERLIYEGGFKTVRQTRINNGTWPTFTPYTATDDYNLSIYNRPYFTNYLWPETVTHMESRWKEVIDVCIADQSTGCVYTHAYNPNAAAAIAYLGQQIQAGNVVHVLPDQL